MILGDKYLGVQVELNIKKKHFFKKTYSSIFEASLGFLLILDEPGSNCGLLVEVARLFCVCCVAPYPSPFCLFSFSIISKACSSSRLLKSRSAFTASKSRSLVRSTSLSCRFLASRAWARSSFSFAWFESRFSISLRK